jgi:hypothetical protein
MNLTGLYYVKAFSAFYVIVATGNPSTHNNVSSVNFHPTKITSSILPIFDN